MGMEFLKIGVLIKMKILKLPTKEKDKIRIGWHIYKVLFRFEYTHILWEINK